MKTIEEIQKLSDEELRVMLGKFIEGVEDINRDAWSDDRTKLRGIARDSDKLLAMVKDACAQSTGGVKG